MISRIKPGNIWLLSGLAVLAAVALYDGHRRLVSYPGKTEGPCPSPTAHTAIILAIGQSNIANEAAVRSRRPS